jgi:hypothetical protein
MLIAARSSQDFACGFRSMATEAILLAALGHIALVLAIDPMIATILAM